MPNPPPIPERLRKIDELIRGEHYHIDNGDDCYFLWEWSPAPYAESATSNFIGNLQKETRFRGLNPWYYKQVAMWHAARALAATVPADWLNSSTFVPMPPSKIKSDERHDSRLLDTLRMVQSPIADIRELVLQLHNTESRGKGISAMDRAHNWTLDESLLLPTPRHIVVFDDLLTGGSHFAGMKIVLARRFPQLPVTGLFLARRIKPPDSLDDPIESA